MAKVFLTCFSPFNLREKPLISSSAASTSTLTDDLFPGLVSSMAFDLQKLRKSLEENGSMSLQWCSEAMFVIKKMHSHLLVFSEKSQVPVSLDHANMIDEYLKESLDLLDFCILLKSAISSIGRYRLKVEFSISRLLDGDRWSPNLMNVEEPPRQKNDKLFIVKKWKEKLSTLSKTKLKRTNHMCVVTRTITSISLLIFCSVLHPNPIKLDEEICCEFPHYSLLASETQKLASCFDEAMREDTRAGLFENLMAEDAVDSLKLQLTEGGELEKEKLLESVEMLRQRSVALKEALELFESVVSEVFEEVIRGRKKVLGLITAKHYKL